MARRCGLDGRGLSDVALAVSEAATNAVIHGARDPTAHLRVAAHITNGELRVAVCDDGAGIRPRLDSPGLGLGLPLIAAVTKSLKVVGDESGTEIHMTFACPDATS